LSAAEKDNNQRFNRELFQSSKARQKHSTGKLRKPQNQGLRPNRKRSRLTAAVASG